MARTEIVAPRGSGLIVIASFCLIVASLWFMQDVLIPLALAVLISFLLAPLVTRLQRLGLHRVGAVMVVAIACLLLIGAIGYVVTHEVFDFARQLPQYRDEIISKLQIVRGDGASAMDKAAEAIDDVQKAVNEPATTQARAPTEAEARLGIQRAPEVPTDPARGDDSAAHDASAVSLPGLSKDKPLWTIAMPEPQSALERLGKNLGLILGPFGIAGLVVVFVIFILIGREDLRDRLIRLMGQGHLNVTTSAIDDAGQRISKYLLAQAIVNGTYGVAIAVGLWIIGATLGSQSFPNFILWGLLCAVLRFIPYIGPWIAAAFPVAVSFAVYPGYGVFIATGVMFIVIELLSNNLMEPWLYGSSTGMSPVAILVSAVFWTFLWGPVGLLLATPMTVCLVVLGKYVPQLAFLDVLLGDEPVLSPPERVYQRLLAMDQEEVTDVAHQYLHEKSLEQVHDEVLMPALAMAEQDRHRGRLDERRQKFIRKALRDVIEELGDTQRQRDEQQARAEAKMSAGDAADAVVSAAKGVVDALVPHSSSSGGGNSGNGKQASAKRAKPGGSVDLHPEEPKQRTRLPRECTVNVLVLPAHDEADEIIALMLAQLLDLQGYCAHAASISSLAGEMVEMVEQRSADVVVVSAMPPAAVAHSRYLCKRINTKYPGVRMIVGLWSFHGDLKKATERITCVGSVAVMTTLREAMDQIHQQIQPLLIRSEAAPATLATSE
ncbi:MAG TPA: AI-2E family transporter [Tepidisphaeraceae bacterium]|nr:AI-2E family transporter [Tepidisphaeraceae bacterium]